MLSSSCLTAAGVDVDAGIAVAVFKGRPAEQTRMQSVSASLTPTTRLPLAEASNLSGIKSSRTAFDSWRLDRSKNAKRFHREEAILEEVKVYQHQMHTLSSALSLFLLRI